MESDLVIESVHQMPVTVHGHRDRAIPEAGLDCLWMLTVGDEPGGVGVAQIVDATGWSYRVGDGFALDPPE
jgi:hypothetical protein